MSILWWVAGFGLAALVFSVWWWPRAPWRGARTRYPVVLAHGFLGFSELNVRGQRQDYFRGVARHLESLGVTVFRPKVSPTASIETRAQELARAIESLPAPRVNIIAHSMGGLDARYAIARLGLATRVASLITVGTPHRGTPIALVGENNGLSKLGMRALLGRLGVGALNDLNRDAMTRFNQDIIDVPGVWYASVIGRVDSERVNRVLKLSHSFITKRTGDNDGVVPVVSQRWGRTLFTIDADHWAQIGWFSNFDALRFYESLAATLRRRGL